MGFSLTMLQAGWEVFRGKAGIEWKTRIAESWNIQSWRGPTRIIGSCLCHIWLDLVLSATCSLKTILKSAATGVCWVLLPNPTKDRWLEKQHVCRCGMWRTHEDDFWSRNLILAWMLLENQQRGFSGNCQSSLVFSVSPGACVGELAFTAGTFLPKTLEKVDEVLPTTVPTARKTSVGL